MATNKTRIAKLENMKPEKVLPSYAVLQADGYMLYYADGRKELVKDKPGRVKGYTLDASPLDWDGDE
jgi:hypothetical protein